LYDDGIGPLGENGLDGELVYHAKVAEGAHERRVARLTLVPRPTQRRKARADEDLVDRREVANPGIAPREGSRVIGEQHWEGRILKTAEPGGDPEMAEVRNDLDAKVSQSLHWGIRRVPLVAVRRDVRAVIRRPEPQRVQSELTDEGKVFLPARVVTAFLHLVDARAGGERGITVLDAGGKEKRRGGMHLRCSQTGIGNSDRRRHQDADARRYGKWYPRSTTEFCVGRHTARFAT